MHGLKTLTLTHLHLPISPLKSSPHRNFLPISSFTAKMPIIEHIVLFKIRNSTDPSMIEAMIANLRSLTSLNIAAQLTAGPLLRSPSFTHLLYSRFRTKTDLAAYSDHPSHRSVVRENVLPICDDIMALDWVADVDDVGDAISPGSLVRLKLSKPREGVAGAEIVGVIDGVRDSLKDSVAKVSYGVNFSPARAKGYEVGFVSVFSGADEADANEGDEDGMGVLVESVIVVDYLVPSPASSL